MNYKSQIASLAMVGLLLVAPALFAATPSSEEMWKIIQQQQQMIERQAAQISALTTSNQQIGEQVEATAVAMEATEQRVSSAVSWAENTQVGGYGELHFNHFDDKDDQADFHRFVLYFNHQFNDRVRFFSEFEVEHSLVADTAGGDNDGEIEIEQAFIEFALNDYTAARAGMFLMPIGIINETHEPNTFYGVERNPVEKRIIPATWWESGVGLSGEVAPGWGYDLAMTTGLDVSDNPFNIRSGRQKSAKATAESFAYIGRLKYTGMPGLELAASVRYEEDLLQGSAADDASAMLYETHVVWNRGDFGLRALYAMWDIDSQLAESMNVDKQDGWYVEPSYQVSEQWGLFARYNEWDNGGLGSTEIEQTNFGVNYWPVENVVFKFDVQEQDGAKDEDGFNLGVGYQF